jgi:YfiH family protein
MLKTFIAAPQPTAGFAWTQPAAAVGPALQCGPLAAIARHLFTARHLELRSDPAEWQAAAAALGSNAEAIRLVRQVHGAAVAVAGPEPAPEWITPEADIIVSGHPQVVIAVRVADCTPILLADSKRLAVGAVHAGWRGTLRGAAQTGVAALRREFGSEPADLLAAVGPCLGVCCGEVGDEVVQAFRLAGHGERSLDRWFSMGPGGRWHLNLARANLDQLLDAGLRPASIYTAGLCTRSFPAIFHSYRAAGVHAGRMAALIRCGSPPVRRQVAGEPGVDYTSLIPPGASGH